MSDTLCLTDVEVNRRVKPRIDLSPRNNTMMVMMMLSDEDVVTGIKPGEISPSSSLPLPANQVLHVHSPVFYSARNGVVIGR